MLGYERMGCNMILTNGNSQSIIWDTRMGEMIWGFPRIKQVIIQKSHGAVQKGKLMVFQWHTGSMIFSERDSPHERRINIPNCWRVPRIQFQQKWYNQNRHLGACDAEDFWLQLEYGEIGPSIDDRNTRSESFPAIRSFREAPKPPCTSVWALWV